MINKNNKLTKEEKQFSKSHYQANTRIVTRYYDPDEESNFFMKKKNAMVNGSYTIYVNRLPKAQDMAENFLKVLHWDNELNKKLTSRDFQSIANTFIDFLTINDWKNALTDEELDKLSKKERDDDFEFIETCY